MVLNRTHAIIAAAVAAVLSFGLALGHCTTPTPTAPPALGFQFPAPSAPINGVPVFNVKSYGALGDGVTDDRSAITSAITAACAAGGGIVFFPASTTPYHVTKNGSNTYALNIACSNITLMGVRGQSEIQIQTGLGGAVDVVEIQDVDHTLLTNLIIDGNWGDAVTYVSQTSNNQALSGTYTLNVDTTTGSMPSNSAFPASGPYTLQVISSAGTQTVTCTGKTATTFTSCTGGTGTLSRGAGVGLHGDNVGINHTTLADPNNSGILVRGSTNLTLDGVDIRQIYGDCISLNAHNINRTHFPRNVRIHNSTCDMAERMGVNANLVIGMDIDHDVFSNVRSTAIFSQPFQNPVRDVQVQATTVTGWWDNSANGGSIAISVDGGGTNGGWSGLAATLRNWRVHDNTLYGSNSFTSVFDFTFERNHVVANFSGTNLAPIDVQFGGGEIKVADNWVYSRQGATGTEGTPNTGAVAIYNYANGTDGAGNTIAYCPSRVTVSNNVVQAKNGRHGILLTSPGCKIKNATGTATGVTDTTLTDSGATWHTNEWIGSTVRMGAAWAVVSSNTSTVLTLANPISSGSTDWTTYYGDYTPTPPTGTYVLHRGTGVVDVASNSIDLSDDGYGAGAKGIMVTGSNNDIPGMRVRLLGNKIQDATTDGIYLSFRSTNTFALLDIENNFGWDDRPTASFTNLITTTAIPNVTKWVMRGNIAGEGVTNVLSTADTFTANSTTDIITTGVNNGLRTNDGPIFVSTTGTLPSPLTVSTPYWYINASATTGKLATSYANAKAGTNIDLTTNGTGTLTLNTQNWLVGTFDSAGNNSQPHCSVGTPTINNGTLAAGSTNCIGSISSVGATSTVLTFSGAYGTTAFCTTTIETNAATHITITRDKAAPTFSCFDTSNVAATCPDFTYYCEGI